jgi:hypothetical protein
VSFPVRLSAEGVAMARMSREFSLVLLGAGLLSAGYFLYPEQEPLNLDKEEAGGPAGNNQRARSSRVHHIIIFHSTTTAARTSQTSRSFTGSTTRGGFGRSGVRISGG